MFVNNILNKNVIQKLKVINLETDLISNEEFNTLDGIDINTTIQNQINNLSSGSFNNLETIYINIVKDLLIPNPIIFVDDLNLLFKLTSNGNIYCTDLYINSTLINFSNFATLTNLLNYVTNSNLNSILNGYRMVSDSWSRSDTTNEINIRTGYTSGTCKAVDDALIEAQTATDADVATLDASVLVLDASVTTLEGELITLQGEVVTLEGQVETNEADIVSINEKIIYQTAGADGNGNFTKFTSNLYINDNFDNTIILNNLGDITSKTLKCNSISSDISLSLSSLSVNVNTQNSINKNTYINGQTVNILSNSQIGSQIIIGNALGSTSIYGSFYVNGIPYVPFNVLNGMIQWI